jgi:hypothetical protein
MKYVAYRETVICDMYLTGRLSHDMRLPERQSLEICNLQEDCHIRYLAHRETLSKNMWLPGRLSLEIRSLLRDYYMRHVAYEEIIT